MNNSQHSRNFLLYKCIALAVELLLLGIIGFARQAAWNHLPSTLLDNEGSSSSRDEWIRYEAAVSDGTPFDES